MTFNPVPLENVPSTSTNNLFKPMQVNLPGGSGEGVGDAVPKETSSTGVVGIATVASREDHQHPDPTIARVTGLQAALDAKATSAALVELEARVAALEGAGA